MSNIARCRPRFHRTTLRNAVRTVAGVVILASAAACTTGGGMFEPSERLTPALKATLDSLMLNEWGAQARYTRVLQDFGSVSPFTALRTATSRRVSVLEKTYLELAEFPPANPYRAKVGGSLSVQSSQAAAGSYESISHACEVSVTLEQETVDRYSRLLSAAPPRIVALAAKENRALSLESVIPAAQRCR